MALKLLGPTLELILDNSLLSMFLLHPCVFLYIPILYKL